MLSYLKKVADSATFLIKEKTLNDRGCPSAFLLHILYQEVPHYSSCKNLINSSKSYDLKTSFSVSKTKKAGAF